MGYIGVIQGLYRASIGVLYGLGVIKVLYRGDIVMLRLYYRDSGKEYGNCYSIKGLILGFNISELTRASILITLLRPRRLEVPLPWF